MKKLSIFILLAPITWLSIAQKAPINYINHWKSEKEIIINTTQGFLFIEKWSDNSYRFSFSPDSISKQPSDAVVGNCLTQNFSLTDSTIESNEASIKIQKKPFGITFCHNSTNKTIQFDIYNNLPNNNSGFSFSLTQDEQITGGGSRAIPLNRRNRLLKLSNEPHWGYENGQENLNYSIPVFISNKKYLLFFDAPQHAWADIGKTDSTKLSLYSTKNSFSCFLVLGSNYQQLIENYTVLTGKQPLPPIWALGNLQSRFGYQSQTETMQIADTMQKAGFPMDAIIIDLFWFGKGPKNWGMGNLEWDKENWPTPNLMTSELKEKGIKTIIITEPFILKTAKQWHLADSLKLFGKDSANNSYIIKDFYFGPASLVDVFDSTASNWFWQQYTRLKKNNIAGWWGDLGEPERHPDGIQYKSGLSQDLHNTYGHYWSKLLSDGYSAEFPNERLFFLNRAGYAGSQRYSVFPWSGDVSRSWNGFKAQLPIMLGMALNGIPYMHSDLGGFAMGTKDEELYRRWLQFGVFNPIFRPHGENIPSEPIFFNDTTQKIVKEAIKLRYRLMPYNYTLAWEQTMKGWPLARPLIWYHPNSDNLFNISDNYYWGESFLVSPITEKGQTSKNIYLPQGIWFDFFTNEQLIGGDSITVNINNQTIPVFAKAGSIIPMAPDFLSTDNYPTDTLLIKYYSHPSVEQSTYTLFTDDGINAKSIAENQFQLINFKGNTSNKEINIEVNSSGSYVNMPNKRTVVFEVCTDKKPSQIRINNSSLKKNQFEFNKILKTVKFTAQLQSNTIKVNILK